MSAPKLWPGYGMPAPAVPAEPRSHHDIIPRQPFHQGTLGPKAKCCIVYLTDDTHLRRKMLNDLRQTQPMLNNTKS